MSDITSFLANKETSTAVRLLWLANSYRVRGLTDAAIETDRMASYYFDRSFRLRHPGYLAA